MILYGIIFLWATGGDQTRLRLCCGFAESGQNSSSRLFSVPCHLAATAAVEFAGRGYPVMEMEGGFRTWQELDLPVER